VADRHNAGAVIFGTGGHLTKIPDSDLVYQPDGQRIDAMRCIGRDERRIVVIGRTTTFWRRSKGPDGCHVLRGRAPQHQA
jgi:hypothetical protein